MNVIQLMMFHGFLTKAAAMAAELSSDEFLRLQEESSRLIIGFMSKLIMLAS